MKTYFTAFLLLATGLMAACSSDDDHVWPSYEMQFIELLTDAQGATQQALLDNGERLAVLNPFSGLRPDSAYRYVAYLVRQNGGVQVNGSPALAPHPIQLEENDSLYTDSLQLKSIWRGGNYVNLSTQVKGMTGRHKFGFIDNGITATHSGGRLLHLVLFHQSMEQIEAYSRTAYLSCPLYHYADSLVHGRDSIVFTVNEYKKGPSSYRFAY